MFYIYTLYKYKYKYTFIEFKSEILDKSETISGGKMETYIIQKETMKHNKVKHNKVKHNKTRKNLEIRRERERLARERFRERMNIPIGTSSKYVLPTKEMEEEFNQIKKMFNLDY